jgi:hypothetical protein
MPGQCQFLLESNHNQKVTTRIVTLKRKIAEHFHLSKASQEKEFFKFGTRINIALREKVGR